MSGSKLKVLILALVLPATAQATTLKRPPGSLPGGSAAARDVAEWHNGQNPGCRFERVEAVELDGVSENGSAHLWRVSACSNRIFTYRVRVLPHEGGGITVVVSNISPSPADSLVEAAAPTPAECAEMRTRFDSLHDNAAADSDYVSLAQLAADLAVCEDPGVAP